MKCIKRIPTKNVLFFLKKKKKTKKKTKKKSNCFKNSVSVSFISTSPQTKTNKSELVYSIQQIEQQKEKKEEATKRLTLCHAQNLEKDGGKNKAWLQHL